MKYAYTYTYSHDKLNRLNTATLIAPTGLSFIYNDNGSVRQVNHANGATTDYTWEANGPVRQITVTGSGGQLAQRETKGVRVD